VDLGVDEVVVDGVVGVWQLDVVEVGVGEGRDEDRRDQFMISICVFFSCIFE
jgi:hypothetical protein